MYLFICLKERVCINLLDPTHFHWSKPLKPSLYTGFVFFGCFFGGNIQYMLIVTILKPTKAQHSEPECVSKSRIFALKAYAHLCTGKRFLIVFCGRVVKWLPGEGCCGC